MHTLKLRPREERRLRAGHAWIYSNEIDTAATPLKGIEPGALCRIEDARGAPLGLAYVNPKVLLCGRLLTGNPGATIDAEWIARRLQTALDLRTRLYPTPHYRLVYGEGDALPGLVVDRYGDVLVAQFSTAGMERLKPLVLEALQAVLAPSGILLRNDVAMRELEGLPQYTEWIGTAAPALLIDEGGTQFEVPTAGAQKTGWFFDQRDNRDRFLRYVPGKRVLDVFSYAGGWGVRAACAGAQSVLCVDAAEPALAAVRANAARNGVAVDTRQGDALDVMKALHAQGQVFDVVVVDPPALIKRAKDEQAGLGHYAALNRAAMNLLAPDAILVSCSCSFHLEAEQLLRILLRESRATGHRLQLLENGGQGPDHPVHPAIPETRYLKAVFCRLTQG